MFRSYKIISWSFFFSEVCCSCLCQWSCMCNSWTKIVLSILVNWRIYFCPTHFLNNRNNILMPQGYIMKRGRSVYQEIQLPRHIFIRTPYLISNTFLTGWLPRLTSVCWLSKLSSSHENWLGLGFTRETWYWTFQMLQPFNTNSAVVTPTMTLYPLLLPICNFPTFMNLSLNICFLLVLGKPHERVIWYLKGHKPTGWESLP